MQEAQDLIIRTQTEDKRLHLENLKSMNPEVDATKIPPPPILLSRTDTTMVFKPAPFIPESGDEVCSAALLITIQVSLGNAKLLTGFLNCEYFR